MMATSRRLTKFKIQSVIRLEHAHADPSALWVFVPLHKTSADKRQFYSCTKHSRTDDLSMHLSIAPFGNGLLNDSSSSTPVKNVCIYFQSMSV